MVNAAVLHPRSPWLRLRARSTMFRFGDATTTHIFDLGNERIRFVKLFHIIAPSYALAHDQDVRHGPPASGFGQQRLKLLAQRIDIEFDDVGFGHDFVLFE